MPSSLQNSLIGPKSFIFLTLPRKTFVLYKFVAFVEFCNDTYCYGSVLSAVLETHWDPLSINSCSLGLGNYIELFH